MQDSPITTADIATMATIAAIVFGGIFKGVSLLVDYLTAKFGSSSGSVLQETYDHQKIEALILAQNRNMEKMLEQNGKQIDALTSFSHQAELRHQIVMAKLEMISTLHSRN